MSERFTHLIWQENAALYDQTVNHPFNVELAQGTLSETSFRHYIVQDAHYLADYGRALAVTAAKAPQADYVIQFASAARISIEVERSLHDSYMKRFGIDAEMFETTPKSMACDHYTSYLLAACWSESWPVALSALLPCYWIYAEVGNAIVSRSVAGNPYQDWIDTYSGEEFQREVRAVIDVVDEAAAQADAHTRRKMQAAYRKSAQLEWIFWDSAYHNRFWPDMSIKER